MRIIPVDKYRGLPCSYVGTGCAYEDITKKEFDVDLPDSLKSDGYMTLEGENKFLRQFLPVKKKVYYKRSERILLRDFLRSNTDCCCICVLGHFIYAKGGDYWSFFNNDNDPVVCVWYL